MKYRVDVFYDGKHECAFFETREKAMSFAMLINRDDMTVFLLEKVTDGFYDVITML